MPKDDLKNNIKLAEKEKEYLDKVKFYKSQADSLKDTAIKSLKNDKSTGKNPNIKVTDRLKNIKDLVVASDGQKLALKNDIKDYVAKQPIDAAAAFVNKGPKGIIREVINQPIYNKIDQQNAKSADYEKIINQIKYEAGERDPFKELRREYGVTSAVPSISQQEQEQKKEQEKVQKAQGLAQKTKLEITKNVEVSKSNNLQNQEILAARDSFKDLRQKYGVSAQNSAVNQNKPQNLPKGKSKSSSYER